MNWEIKDERGVIYSGTEEEINSIWHNTTVTGKTPRVTEWEGDLKLVQVHAITR